MTSPSAPAHPATDDADAPRRREEAVRLAADLLRVDSTNGNETAVAEVLAEYLADAGVTRMSIQQLGVDTVLFNPSRGDRARLIRRLGLADDTRLLVFAGRPAREKNIDSMVAAVERLGDPYREGLEEITARNGPVGPAGKSLILLIFY